MDIKEAKEDFKSSIAMTLLGGKHTIVSIKAIETVLAELEKKDKMIDEMAKMLVEVPINSSDTPATAAAKAEIRKDLEILKNALINYISEKIEGEE